MENNTQQKGGLNFTKQNIRWMIIGVIVIALGMFLLSGGENTNPNVFDTNLVYSTRRITIAPIVILLGFGIEVFAILKRSKNASE
ncbi:DUF3098 domain-containing protein [Arachidicoccus sp.]|jgi:hypothetical protein|uniref:DUF3098 domain-containing protein n=1 Tax=Arachidicoccus sp. TaxID=1872624 RepID=UPI003D2037C0